MQNTRAGCADKYIYRESASDYQKSRLRRFRNFFAKKFLKTSKNPIVENALIKALPGPLFAFAPRSAKNFYFLLSFQSVFTVWRLRAIARRNSPLCSFRRLAANLRFAGGCSFSPFKRSLMFASGKEVAPLSRLFPAIGYFISAPAS